MSKLSKMPVMEYFKGKVQVPCRLAKNLEPKVESVQHNQNGLIYS